MFWYKHGLAGLDRDISDYQGFFDRHGYYAIEGDILGWTGIFRYILIQNIQIYP